MIVRFVERAEEEIDQAIRHYEAQLAGLGEAFRLEVDTAANLVAERPDAWQKWKLAFAAINLIAFHTALSIHA